jgi:PST family polysaccharide transporter
LLKIKGETRSKLIRNFSSLTILQISNYLFPLITVPYLVRILGVENYGLANFVIAFTAYFITFSDYGFNLSATREAALNKNNNEELSIIFNSVLLIKLILFFSGFLLFSAIVFSFEIFSKNYILYLIAFISVLGNVLFPSWFFQGIERMNLISIFSIIVKVLFVISIFLFVKSINDVDLYLIINSASSLILGLVTIYYVYAKLNIKFLIPSKNNLTYQLKEGFHIFLSTLSINLYTTSNTFLLGLLAGNQAVGIFSGANKIREAYQGLLGNFGRTFYPHISEQFKENRSKAFAQIKKYSVLVVGLSFISGLILFILAPQIISLVLGPDFREAVSVFQILAFVPAIIMISNIAGIQIMLNLGYKK